MFRAISFVKPRPAAAVVVGALLASTALTSTVASAAVTPVADLEATVLQLGGPAVSGSVIAAGTSLTRVRLTTSDPEATAGDGLVLSAAVPEVRSVRPRFVIPGVPAEAATFRINGSTVATSVPDLRFVSLQTDQGAVPAVVFNAGGASYAIPRLNVPIGAVSRVVGASTLNTAKVSNLNTYEYSLLPLGAKPRLGVTFQQGTYGPDVTSSGSASYSVYDADALRGNADSTAEELALADLRGLPANGTPFRLNTPGADVLATVTLSSGSTTTVRGVRFRVDFSYGEGLTTWAFDRAGLAAVGASASDVTAVVSYTSTVHALTWQDLGFDLI